ncbi:DUF1203 domain-containing protein [Phenylobacterium sp. J367]|uniref:DUF1203 domain-containing protein n=1 Tax=Phenylobacterium sp. J367 TaxID=2898435 RepID=UPI002150CC15|nr:DUF1203 domain-containing protein [Phenylobacterium sp. J367]MCR5879923.1 DUF1203 domain-containing protein [Phenylobacterium sp. J367]
MAYVVTGLPLEDFRPLFGLPDEDLAARGVRRYAVDAPVGFPCRITLADARPGETVLLLNYEHQSADTPYRSRHAIFVSERASETARYLDEIPPCLAVRPMISLRAFDAAGMMVDAALAPGSALEPEIRRLLDRPDTAYIHAHNAGRGCYAARIERG